MAVKQCCGASAHTHSKPESGTTAHTFDNKVSVLGTLLALCITPSQSVIKGGCMMQYAACLAALSSETDDTLAALDQLDADSIEHAEFLATYHDQASDNCIFVLFEILVVCIIALLAVYTLTNQLRCMPETRSTWPLTWC